MKTASLLRLIAGATFALLSLGLAAHAATLDDIRQASKVGVGGGTTEGRDLTQEAKGGQLVRYEDDATMALAVASGQVDILATARSLLPAISKKNPARTVEPKITMQTFYLAIGMRKDEPKLLAWVNGWVKTNLMNGNLAALYHHYHRVDIPTDDLLSNARGPPEPRAACSH